VKIYSNFAVELYEKTSSNEIEEAEDLVEKFYEVFEC